MKPRHRLLDFVGQLGDRTIALADLFSRHEAPVVASRPAPEDDLEGRFHRELDALGGEVIDRPDKSASSTDADALTSWFRNEINTLGRPLQVAVDPQLVEAQGPGHLPGLLNSLRTAGCDVVLAEGQDGLDQSTLAEVDLGITLADLAIAETGTLVETVRPKRPRALSLLPPHHLCIVPRSRLVPDLEAVFDHLGDPTSNDPFQSYFTCISGPSRTADIEKQLTIGVHGPGRLTVFFVDGPVPH